MVKTSKRLMFFYSHCGDDKQQGEVHPDRNIKVLVTKVVGEVGNDDEHDGGEAVGEDEAHEPPLELDADGDGAGVGGVGTDGVASDGVGGLVQGPRVHDGRGHQPRGFLL